MAAKKTTKTKAPTKATSKKSLAKLASATRAPGKKGRETLHQAREVLGDELAAVVDELGVLEAMVAHKDMEAVELLLEWGADPNALPKRATSESRSLGRPFGRAAEWSDDERVTFVRRLLRAGARPDELHPSPKHVRYGERAWGQYKSALDLAIEKRSDAIADLLAIELDPTTVASAVSVAVRGSSLVNGGFLAVPGRELRRTLGHLEAILDEHGTPELADRYGTSPMHVAAITANLEAARLLLEHGAPPNAEVAETFAYGGGDDRHFAPLGSGGFDTVAIPAGARPLDALDHVRRYLEKKLAKTRNAADATGRFDTIAARLDAMAVVEGLIEAHGGTRSGATVARPSFTEVIDPIFRPLVGERFDAEVRDLNMLDMGPWGYLIKIGELFPKELELLERLTDTDPVAFVVRGKHTEQTVALYDDTDYGPNSIFGEIDYAIDPDAYPEEARELFEHPILGKQGPDILVLQKSPEGTRLFRIDHARVSDEGTLEGGLLAQLTSRMEAIR